MTTDSPRRTCWTCDGDGGFLWDEEYDGEWVGDEWTDCYECHGLGTVVDLEALGEPACPVCEGVGYMMPGRSCAACDGAGYAGGASPHAKG